MPTVNMHQAKTHLSRLVDEAAAGEEVIIARNGKPVAKLVPFQRRLEPRRFGTMRGLIWIADDFDELPPELEAAFYGDGE